MSEEKDYLMLSVDTETGGFDCKGNALLTIGFAWISLNSLKTNKLDKNDFNDNSIELKFKCDKSKVTADALKVNHLDLNDLQENGVDYKDGDMKLLQVIENLRKLFRVQLLGQNLKFDLGFIKEYLPLTYNALMKLHTHHELQTASLLYFLSNDSSTNTSISMDNMRKHFSMQEDNAHSALVDAIDNLLVFNKIILTRK